MQCKDIKRKTLEELTKCNSKLGSDVMKPKYHRTREINAHTCQLMIANSVLVFRVDWTVSFPISRDYFVACILQVLATV
jgi:hypothetical protein